MHAAARWFLVVSALLLAVATGLGAWAAHGLEQVIEPAAVATFRTGVEYHFYHALGLLGVGVLINRYEFECIPAGERLAAACRYCAVQWQPLRVGVYAGRFSWPDHAPGWVVLHPRLAVGSQSILDRPARPG